MDQPARPFTSGGADTRRWMARIIIAVILGEALWGLLVSLVNNVFVPWLGDAMGPSSGLPTSFTQRPYNYPDLFVSVFEFCVAGLVAAILNYFFQPPTASRVKTSKSSIPAAPPGPIRVVPQAAPSAGLTETAPPQFGVVPSPAPDAAQEARLYPVIPSILVPAAQDAGGTSPPAPQPAAPVPPVAPTPVAPVAEAKPAAAAPAPAAAKPVAQKPVPPAPKPEPAKPKKPKNVYYNIVGEPVSSDDD
ncbi:MAG TPA: hypothetical protein VEU11_16405 [Terriglobales bacterium]|nr:hypothetical protein [Terriglobales bacterium]